MNRCEVQALQRKDLERTTKEWPCSLRTVGYGWVGMGDGGWKRVALDGNKERFVQIERLLAQKRRAFENSKERLVQKESFWFVKTFGV